ncbi:MAG: sugar-transfer associated ATP-grasp domain-containing protein, partial [Arenibacter latericius]|nr:sugar-transfer associated ATP-grasp domain-containing protein [Arenibacter latericius]
GFFVGVNMDEGTLKKNGHYMPEYGGKLINKHPDSGFKIEGFKIPYFKEACEEVLKGVKIIPDRFIGWDVAISTMGPVIVEANSGPHLPSADIGYGGLLQNRHIKKLIEELKQESN